MLGSTVSAKLLDLLGLLGCPCSSDLWHQGQACTWMAEFSLYGAQGPSAGGGGVRGRGAVGGGRA